MSQSKEAFKSAYKGHERKPVETGSMYQNEYGYNIDAYGRKVLIKTGETNLYEKIQMSLEETKIENILARAMAGDTSMLNPNGGIYADVSNMPKNLIEARQAMQNLENTWNGLPMSIKNKYDNDLDTFIGASGSETWLRDMGLLPAEAKEIAAATEAAQAEAPKTIDGMGEVNE